MRILNKRNAFVGWAVIKLGRRAAKKKARGVVPGTVDDSRRRNASAVAVALTALGGALVFWRRRGQSAPESDES